MTRVDTSTTAFVDTAVDLAADIDRETAEAGHDPVWLTEVARAATVAVDRVAAARRRAEDALFAARQRSGR